MVVDEVLAVGDAEFQRKCLGKMADIERAGRTVLFVSHNLDAIQRLCPRSLWLERGEVAMTGPTREVMDAYIGTGLHPAARTTFDVKDPSVPVRLCSVALLDDEGRPGRAVVDRDRPFTVEVEYEVHQRLPGLDLSLVLSNSRGVRMLDEAWSDHHRGGQAEPGRYLATLTVPPVLAVGDYVAGVWMGSAYEGLVWEDEALVFRLEGNAAGRTERVLHLSLPWQVRQTGWTDDP
jgi:hypothetical protein